MVAEPARDVIPEWDGQANTLERFEEDVLIFTHAVPKERSVTIGPKLLEQFLKGSPQREIGLELLKSGVLQLEDGDTAAEAHSASQRERFGKKCPNTTNASLSARLYQQSMQHDIAEESNLHERALQAVGSVSIPSEGEVETKEIIADVLRDFFCWKTRHSQDLSKCLS